MREIFTPTRGDDSNFRHFPLFPASKSLGIVSAKQTFRNGLTAKAKSLEFANCLPKKQPTKKVYEEIQ